MIYHSTKEPADLQASLVRNSIQLTMYLLN